MLLQYMKICRKLQKVHKQQTSQPSKISQKWFRAQNVPTDINKAQLSRLLCKNQGVFVRDVACLFLTIFFHQQNTGSILVGPIAVEVSEPQASDWPRVGHSCGFICCQSNEPTRMFHFQPIRGHRNCNQLWKHVNRYTCLWLDSFCYFPTLIAYS